MECEEPSLLSYIFCCSCGEVVFSVYVYCSKVDTGSVFLRNHCEPVEKLWKEVERKQLPPVCYLLGQRSLLCSVQ